MSKTKQEESLKIRKIKNVNITINSKRVLREVIEILEVGYGTLSKKEKELVKDAVETTLWELFERKEERLKGIIDKDEYEWEFRR